MSLAGCGAGSGSDNSDAPAATSKLAAVAAESGTNGPALAVSTKAPLSTSALTNLTPLQVVQKIFHDQVDWYPGNNDPYSQGVYDWAANAAAYWFTSDRTFEQAYAATQAAIVADARRYDGRIPAEGHPVPRATYNAPTLPWMSSLLDTGTATPAASWTASVNAVDTAVNDMKLNNDAVLRGYEDRTSGWYVGPGYVMLGNTPRLSNTSWWWQAANPGRASYDAMQAALPWVVIFDGVDNYAWNTRVQIRNYRAYYKSRSSGAWVMLGSSAGVSGAVYGKASLFGAMTAENRRTSADGSSEIKPPSDGNVAWHGWWERGRVAIPPDDIAALFVTLQARLVVDNPSQGDDRDNARYLVQVGTDYYRDSWSSWDFVVPSAMTSRSKLVTNWWQSFSATTFSDVGMQDPGGGISEAEFRAAPPPLE